jgi:hypothetical protein
MFSWEPSPGIFAPTALRYQRISLDEPCLTHHEHLQGLITLLAFLTLGSLRSCFIPEALLGFSTQSFLPDLKLPSFRIRYFHALGFKISHQTPKNKIANNEATLRSLVPQIKQYLIEVY